MSVSIGHKTISVLGARHIVCTWDIVGQRTIGKRGHNVCSFGYIGTVYERETQMYTITIQAHCSLTRTYHRYTYTAY